MDHISKLVSKNKQNRVKKISQVKKNVKNELEILKSYMNRLEAEPVIKNIFKYTDKLRKKELQKAIKVLGEKDDKRIKIINELTKSVLECILTIPMNNIRKKTENGEIDALNIIKNIFDYKKL